MQSMPMCFQVKMQQFDTQGKDTRGAEWQWENGAVVYLQFHNGESVIRGYANYSSSTNSWTVQSWFGSLSNSGVCEVYYFEGITTFTESLTLNPQTGIYADRNGSYKIGSDGVVTLEAYLEPQTSRVRFSGASGVSMNLNGVTTYSGYNAETNTFSTSTATVSRTVSSDGYTPYVYCTLTNTSSREITITNSVNGSDVWFLRAFPATAFRIGETGLLTLPTKETNRGWTVTGPPALSVGTTGLSFTTASATKSIAINCNRNWTATTSASWLTLSPASGKNNGTLSVTASAYSGSGDRQATISVTSGTLNVTIYVSQGQGRVFTITGNGKTVEFMMKKVEKGTFAMGRAGTEDVATPVHSVTLTKDYYMGETEVTQALWYAVMGQSPTTDGSQWNTSSKKGDNYPAYYISYNDCQTFINALNTKIASQLSSGEQFRFPTEAEWEFAAKGGTKTKGYTYSGSHVIGEVAWYSVNSSSLGSSNENFGTHVVKTKAPNELGLYDMSGNVWEWCYDWYGSYSSGAQTDPTGATSGSYRVLRGGSWNYDAEGCRVALRGSNTPTSRDYSIGFRLAL